MTFKYRLLIFIISFLTLCGFIIWIITRTSTIDLAKENLNESKSYGEIKGVWQEYQNDLSDNREWKKMVGEKLKHISLNTNQKRDLVIWFPDSTFTKQEGSSEFLNRKKIQPDIENHKESLERDKRITDIKPADKTLSTIELARFYNKQGDEKCKAFKAAKAPHLYHIANEYYEYAATLTNSNPKVCE